MLFRSNPTSSGAKSPATAASTTHTSATTPSGSGAIPSEPGRRNYFQTGNSSSGNIISPRYPLGRRGLQRLTFHKKPILYSPCMKESCSWRERDSDPASSQPPLPPLPKESSSWRERDSNPRPAGYEPAELPLLHPATSSVPYCTMLAACAPSVVSSAVMMVMMSSPMRRSAFFVLSFIVLV